MRQFYTVRWTIRILSVLLPGALTALAEYMITGGVAGWAPLVAAVIGGLASVIVLWLVDKRKLVEPPETQIPSTPTADGKDFSPRTSAELLASVQGLTEVAAERASERHVGLWLRVDGNVLDVIEDSRSITVFMAESDDKARLFLEFPSRQWSARLRSLDLDDPISAVGRITRIARQGYISLEDCELFE